MLRKVRPESAVMRLLRLFGRGCFRPRGTEIADSTHSACRREESHGSHVNGSLLLSCLAPGIHDIIRSKDMQCSDVICTPRFPTISQPFPNHFPTISQPFFNHFPTISQPFPNHVPTMSQPFPNHFPTIFQPIPNHFPTISQPFPNHFSTISQFPNHFPTIFQPFFNHFRTIFQPGWWSSPRRQRHWRSTRDATVELHAFPGLHGLHLGGTNYAFLAWLGLGFLGGVNGEQWWLVGDKMEI